MSSYEQTQVVALPWLPNAPTNANNQCRSMRRVYRCNIGLVGWMLRGPRWGQCPFPRVLLSHELSRCGKRSLLVLVWVAESNQLHRSHSTHHPLPLDTFPKLSALAEMRRDDKIPPGRCSRVLFRAKWPPHHQDVVPQTPADCTPGHESTTSWSLRTVM
jgi:hypothetical protein